MEILVRRNDLVKELQLVQGIVERKNSIPILSNVLAEARSGELRISATDLDVSLRCGCAAQVVEEGAVTLGREEALRDRALAPGERREREGRGRRLGQDQVREGGVQDGRAPPRGLPEHPRGAGGQGRGHPGRRPARAHPADRVRDHGRGRALLPGGSAPGARQGRGGHGRHRRPPPGLGPEDDGAQGGGAHASPRAPQGDHRARPAHRGHGGRGSGELPPGRGAPHLRRRRPDARLEDGRGPVPRLREGGRRHRRQEGGGGPRRAAKRHPPREPALLGARARGPA